MATMTPALLLLALALAAVSGLPREAVVGVRDPGPRYQHVDSPGADGGAELVDLWLKVSDLEESARYDPGRSNVYHLFTRDNPTVSQPLMMNSVVLLEMTNFDSSRRTVFLLHGWRMDATADCNAVLVSAFLAADDVNVVVLDWSSGADTINYLAAISNAMASGPSVARFIEWLKRATGAGADSFHIVGHDMGAHKAGIVGRNVEGGVAYVTGLSPSFAGWILNSNKFQSSDGFYTEVIHTNAGLLGYLGPLANVDFYPNGGINMPGCSSQQCDHDRSFHYFAESLTRGGFTGRRCATFITAMAGGCWLWGNLNMGGLQPKTGSSGIYHLETNRSPPFSRG